MEATTPTSQPGAVGGGGNCGSGSSQTPPVLNWPALTNRQKIDATYRLKCIAAEQELAERLPRVWSYCQQHRAAGRSWHWCYGLKLLELWDILQRERPLSILELGSGCTTAVFSEYVAANDGWPSVVSVDESDSWQEFVRNAIGKRRIEFRLSDKSFVYQGPRLTVRYDSLPPGNPEFIYVDGPDNRQGSTLAACTDCLMYMNGAATLVAFDIRRETVDYLNGIVTGYSWEPAVWSDGDVPWYLSSLRHHTIARRRA